MNAEQQNLLVQALEIALARAGIVVTDGYFENGNLVRRVPVPPARLLAEWMRRAWKIELLPPDGEPGYPDEGPGPGPFDEQSDPLRNVPDLASREVRKSLGPRLLQLVRDA